MGFKNKEQKLAYNAQWKKDNRERVNQCAREARAKRREEYNAGVREYTRLNKEHIEATRIQRTYNISKDEFLRLKEVSSGKCFICQTETKLVVDHNHNTGKVRKLLCGNCNWGLGHFQDNPELLRLAAKYLEDHYA